MFSCVSGVACCLGFLSDYDTGMFFRPPRFIFRSGNVRPSLISGRGLFRPGLNDYSNSFRLAEPNFGRISKRSAPEEPKKPKITFIPRRGTVQQEIDLDKLGVDKLPFELLQIEMDDESQPDYINEVHDNNFIMPVY